MKFCLYNTCNMWSLVLHHRANGVVPGSSVKPPRVPTYYGCVIHYNELRMAVGAQARPPAPRSLTSLLVWEQLPHGLRVPWSSIKHLVQLLAALIRRLRLDESQPLHGEDLPLLGDWDLGEGASRNVLSLQGQLD